MMRPTQATVDLFRAQLGLIPPVTARDTTEQWAYVSGYCVGLTEHDDGFTATTGRQSKFWEQGLQEARTLRRGLK